MPNERVHEYFKRTPKDWSIVDFLNESIEEPFKQKIDRYLKSLETIMDSEQGKRADRAKFLHDNYKKASKDFFFEMLEYVAWRRICSITVRLSSTGPTGHRWTVRPADVPEPRPDRTKAKEWEEKRMKKQVHIHQPNLNAGTVINEINGGTFESVNNEVKFMSKKSDDDDDFQPVPAETTKNTPSSLPKAVLEVSPGSGNFILNVKVEENAGDHFVERIEDHKPTSKHVDRGSSGVVLTLERH
ncbi:22151_t:CDS:2 [Rhizophagus irregularis]|nr:22151_t:CDS:2 [Rhizophagus irregularis]